MPMAARCTCSCRSGLHDLSVTNLSAVCKRIERQAMIMDLKLIKGQESAKRAIEIAVLGSHSILLCGPSGCGKTSLAECSRHLAASSDAVSIYDDIDIDCDSRQLRQDIDQGQAILATAANLPADFALVDRFPIVVMLDQ